MDFRPHDYHEAHNVLPCKPHHILILFLSFWLCAIDWSEAETFLDGHMQYGLGSLLIGFVSVIGEIGE